MVGHRPERRSRTGMAQKGAVAGRAGEAQLRSCLGLISSQEIYSTKSFARGGLVPKGQLKIFVVLGYCHDHEGLDW